MQPGVDEEEAQNHESTDDDDEDGDGDEDGLNKRQSDYD